MANQKNTSKDVKYIDRDFDSLKKGLIEFTKAYYPNTYNDFNEASPGMMFIELAAYVGDVLSFYLDNQFQETFLQYARQTNNLYELAYMFGYKPNVTGVALADINFYQQVPSKLSGSSYVPDFNYALILGHYFSGVGKYYVNAIASGCGFFITLFLSFFNSLSFKISEALLNSPAA